MAATTTKEKVIELKRLAGQAGQNIYQRCKLATEILTDESYCTEVYRDELHAIEQLEGEFFRDVRGFISLGRLRQLYLEYPNEETWAALKYDLAALDAQYREDHKATADKAERHSYKQEAEELRSELERVQADYRRAAAEARELKEANEELREKNQDLHCQLASLNGRIAEMERVINRTGGGVYAGAGA